jgi:DNA (cytosine-5)-methyltransferase 1
MNGNVFDANGISPTLSTNKGEGIKILGYTRDKKGNVTKRHEKDISGTIHTSSGSGGNTDQFVKVGTWRTHKDGQGFRECEDGTCPTVPARAREDGSGQPVIKVKSATSKGYEEATNEDSINFSNPHSKTRRGRVGKGVAQTLDTSCNQGVCIPVLTPDRVEKKQNGRRFKKDGEEMFTITTQDRHGAFNGYRIRRLTPLEVFRLMDFPDNHVEKCKEACISDSQLYKQAGNSIVVRCLELIMDKLKLV